MGNPLKPITSGGKDLLGNAVKTAGEVADDAAKMAKNLADLGAAQTAGDPLNPYKLMYVTELTGFQYILPYFDNTHKTLNNSWGDTQASGSETFGEGAMGLIGKGVEAVGNITQIRNVLEPGKYVEKPQFFNSYSNNKKSYRVTFPLANTGTYSDVLRNWQLVYLLIYQNTQNRLSRTLVAPPVIYEAEIPGVWYSPYAFISDLHVEYLGARRRMEIQVPKAPATASSSDEDSNTPITLDTIIPDVYQVSMTVNDMHPESQNFLHHVVKQRDKVTTYTKWSADNPNASADGTGEFRIPILNKLKNLF